MPAEMVTLLETLLVLILAGCGLLWIEYRKDQTNAPLITHAVRWAWRLQPGVVTILLFLAGIAFGSLLGHFLWP